MFAWIASNIWIIAVCVIVLIGVVITLIIVSGVKKKTAKNAVNRYETKKLKRKQKTEDQDLKTAIKETNEQIRITNKKRRELGRKITFAPMEDLIPIKKAVNRGIDGFELQNNFGFFDIVRVVSFDYSAMDDDDLNMHIFYWDRFYRTTAVPIKRLSLNMPVDTSQQIIYYNNVLARTENPLYREKIIQEIEELRTGFEKRQTRDYFLIYYAEDIDSLINESAHITASLEERGYVTILSPITKLQVFNKLSNPYSYKEMLTEDFIDD